MAFPGLLTMSLHKFTSPATVFSSTAIADALLVIPGELSRMDEEMSTGVCFYTSERSPYAGGSIVCARRFPLWNFESSFERLLNVHSGWGRGACVHQQWQTHTPGRDCGPAKQHRAFNSRWVLHMAIDTITWLNPLMMRLLWRENLHPCSIVIQLIKSQSPPYSHFPSEFPLRPLPILRITWLCDNAMPTLVE